LPVLSQSFIPLIPVLLFLPLIPVGFDSPKRNLGLRLIVVQGLTESRDWIVNSIEPILYSVNPCTFALNQGWH
jgi:hypothetical protein